MRLAIAEYLRTEPDFVMKGLMLLTSSKSDNFNVVDLQARLSNREVLFVRIQEVLSRELEPLNLHITVQTVEWGQRHMEKNRDSHFQCRFQNRRQRLEKRSSSTSQNNYSVRINEQAWLWNKVRIELFQLVVQQDMAIQRGHNWTPVVKSIGTKSSQATRIIFDTGKNHLHLKTDIDSSSHNFKEIIEEKGSLLRAWAIFFNVTGLSSLHLQENK